MKAKVKELDHAYPKEGTEPHITGYPENPKELPANVLNKGLEGGNVVAIADSGLFVGIRRQLATRGTHSSLKMNPPSSTALALMPRTAPGGFETTEMHEFHEFQRFKYYQMLQQQQHSNPRKSQRLDTPGPVIEELGETPVPPLGPGPSTGGRMLCSLGSGQKDLLGRRIDAVGGWLCDAVGEGEGGR